MKDAQKVATDYNEASWAKEPQAGGMPRYSIIFLTIAYFPYQFFNCFSSLVPLTVFQAGEKKDHEIPEIVRQSPQQRQEDQDGFRLPFVTK